MNTESSAFVIGEDTTNQDLSSREYSEFFNMNKLAAVIKSKKVCKPVRAWWKKESDNDNTPEYEIEKEYYENLMKNMRCYITKKGNKVWRLTGVVPSATPRTSAEPGSLPSARFPSADGRSCRRSRCPPPVFRGSGSSRNPACPARKCY